MSNLNHPLLYAFVMFLAGVGIPIAATLSGALGEKLQSPFLAASVLFFVAFLASSTFLLFNQGLPSPSDFKTTESIPAHYYMGGLFIVFYILSITWVGPKFGIGNAIAFVLLGQLTFMTIIDHFSLFNAPSFPVSWQRILGLVIMIAGVLLVVRKES